MSTAEDGLPSRAALEELGQATPQLSAAPARGLAADTEVGAECWELASGAAGTGVCIEHGPLGMSQTGQAGGSAGGCTSWF